MFIEMLSGAMLNLFWLQDCFQGKHDKNIVIFYCINGVKLTEEYDTEAEAEARVEEVHKAMAIAGSKTCDVTSVNGETGDVVLDASEILTTDGVSVETVLTWNEY